MVLTLTIIIKLILDPRVSKGGRSETGEQFLNSQGCTNMKETALVGRKLPITRGNQAEKLDKTERVGQMNFELPGSRFY